MNQVGCSAYYRHRRITPKKKLGEATNMKVYETAIALVVLYTPEITSFGVLGGRELNIERRVVWTIYRPTEINQGDLRRLTNIETSMFWRERI